MSALHLENQGFAVLTPWLLGAGRIVFLGRLNYIHPQTRTAYCVPGWKERGSLDPPVPPAEGQWAI